LYIKCIVIGIIGGFFMKIMNIFRIILAATVVIAVQADAAQRTSKNVANARNARNARNAKRAQRESAAAVVEPSAAEVEAAVDNVTDKARQEVEIATEEAAAKITAATIAKNHAIIAGIEGKMKPDKVKALLEEQDVIIAKVKNDLMQLAEKAVAMVDSAEKQASYASQFISGAQRFGSWIWNPAAEQERNLAQAIIIRLEEEKENTTNPAIIKQLDQQINDQKLITGDKMSTRQLLLIGAVTAAAALAGYTYFKGESTGELVSSSDLPSPELVSPSAPQPESQPISKSLSQTESQPISQSEVKREAPKKWLNNPMKNVLKRHTERQQETQPISQPVVAAPTTASSESSYTWYPRDMYRWAAGKPSVLDEQIGQQEGLKDEDIIEQAQRNKMIDQQIRQQEELKDAAIIEQGWQDKMSQQRDLQDQAIIKDADIAWQDKMSQQRDLQDQAVIKDAEIRSYKKARAELDAKFAREAEQRRQEEYDAMVAKAKETGKYLGNKALEAGEYLGSKAKQVGSAIYEAIKEPSEEQ
jgi:hypothetical protein